MQEGKRTMDGRNKLRDRIINRHDDGVYAKVKKLQYNPRTRSTIVKSKDGRILINNEEIARRWK